MHSLRCAALLSMALLAVSGVSFAQKSQGTVTASITSRRVLLRAPVLIKRSGKWSVTFTLTGDALSLEQGQTSVNLRPIVPVSLRPGTWLPGTLLPGGVVEVKLGEAELAALLPGSNPITVQVPGWQFVNATFDSAPLLKGDADLRAFALARQRPVPLPDALSTATSTWPTWRDWTPQEGAALRPSLQALDSTTELTLASCPGLTFAPPQGKVLVLSTHLARRSVEIAIPGKVRRLYLLLLSMPDARDGSEPFARIIVRCLDGALITRELKLPNPPAPFPTAFAALTGKGESNTLKAPSLVGKGLGLGSPGALNVQDIDLGEMRGVESLTLETIGANAVVALAGITALGNVKSGSLATLSPRLRAIAQVESPTLFAFDTPSLAGWEILGSGWGITDTVGEFFMRKGTSRYFADSKANGGEKATGTILSPPFTVTGSQLTFLANGHSMKNYFALVNAADGKELVRAPAPEKTGPFVKITWDVKAFKGRVVRFKAVDDDDRDAYAWIAFDDIEMIP